MGQEETRKFGNKIAESLVLNAAIIQLLEELRVCMCAHSYVGLNCRSTNNFFPFFPRVSSAQRVNQGSVIKAAAPCRIPSSFVADKVEGWGIDEGEKMFFVTWL